MIVISLTALRAAAFLPGFPVLDAEPGLLTSDITITRTEGFTCVFHREDTITARLVIVARASLELIADTGGLRAVENALQRVDRVARALASPPVNLPPVWKKYQEHRRIAFFALPRPQNKESLRWIAEQLDSGDTCFWHVTSKGAEQRLVEYVADYAMPRAARSTWEAKLTPAVSGLPPSEPAQQSLQQAVDLDVVGANAVSRSRTFSGWKPLLSDGQKKVLAYAGAAPLKIRGAAGTGKTLTLQLKAIAEIYAAAERDQTISVLYLTHSWSLMELVEQSLSTMDELGLARDSLDVMPLTWLHDQLLGPLPDGMEILGDDSLDGKQKQLALISLAIDDIVARDWGTHIEGLSKGVKSGAEADAASPPRVTLCWMLMREFAEVIDANRVRLGVDSFKRYLDIPREPWMAEFAERADREFVYAVYRRYVRGLAEDGYLTTDQGLDGLRSYLEGYVWNVRREKEGYDLILVDEFHLFNDTERYVMHLLTRDAESPPRLIFALDPRQSPFALLTGIKDGVASRTAMERLGSAPRAELYDLTIAYRFTPPIHEFVCLIHQSFPNLVDLGDDWVFDYAHAVAANVGGAVPRVHVSLSPEECATWALREGSRRASTAGSSQRVAVIAAGSEELGRLCEVLADTKGEVDGANQFTLLQSREDLEGLRYSKRAIVVGAAEYCAGLQFAHVVVVAFSGTPLGSGGASAQRAELSQLYLAATRAELTLRVACWGADGAVADVLGRALEQGLARSAN